MNAIRAGKFTSTVRAKLADNRVKGVKPDSIRGLARAMARGNESLAENYRTSLLRWMRPGGPKPSDGNRALVADALGVTPRELADDGEPRTMSSRDDMLAALAVALDPFHPRHVDTDREPELQDA